MKKLFVYLFVIALVFGFNSFSLSEEKNGQKNSVTTCPYLNSLMQSSASSECPFLMKKSEGSEACPYLNEKDASKCPYTEKMREKKLKIEKKSKPEMEIKSS